MELRQALRRLTRSPGFSLTALLMIAVGIGATTAIFSVVNGVLIQPLPYADSDRLVELRQRSANTGDNWLPISPAFYFTYRDGNETLESIALWLRDTASVTGVAEPEEVPVLRVTFEFLSTLGVAPALGRGFAAGDDAAGSPRTVVLSYAYWQRRFGGDAGVLGRALVIGGNSHEIIGVLPQDFRFGRQSADLLLPMQPDPAIAFVGPLGETGLARLRPDVTIPEANADLARLLPRLLEKFPMAGGMDPQVFVNQRLRPDAVTLKNAVVGDLDDVLFVLLGTIAMLLLVACANVANLELVRAEGRGRELAIRAALGASAARLAGGLLLESAVLALAGGVLGIVIAAISLPVLLVFAAAELPQVFAIAIDPFVVTVALGVSVGLGLLFGTLPALKYARGRCTQIPVACEGGHTAGRDRRRAQHVLVIGQIALALVLLVASGLMARSFQELRHVAPGFRAPDQVQAVTITIPQGSVPEFERVIGMLNEMQDRIGAIPGVDGVGFASQLPLQFGPTGGFFLEDRPGPEGGAPPSEFRYTSPRYFETLGTPLIAGRTFEWTDHRASVPFAIVSENFARREWGSPELAIGKRLRMFPGEPWSEIVGVVGDVRQETLEDPAPPSVYLTLGYSLAPFMARRVSFAIRSDRVGTAGFLEDVQRAIWSVDASLPLASVRTLGDIYAESMARTSLTLVLLGITAVMALLLGLVGVYGTISYLLARRTREIGIRIAVGAPHSAMRRLLLAQVVALVGAGVGLGLGGAAALARLMTSLLYGVTAFDATTYVAVSALLIGTALLAGYLPARRAAQVDPVQALREE